MVVVKRFERKELPIVNKASEFINMVENNTGAMSHIREVNVKLPPQNTGLSVLHSILPHPIGHSTSKYLRCEDQSGKSKMK